MAGKRIQCPKCAEEGADSKRSNATLYPDGGIFCHKKHGRINDADSTMEAQVSAGITVAEVLSMPIGGDPSRGISLDTFTKYNVRCSFDTVSGLMKRVFYPYSDISGVYTGAKIRTLPKDFFVAGKLNGVFGKAACHASPKGPLFITEGEEDALALSEMFRVKRQIYADVVSLPNGANTEGRLDPDTQRDLDFFKKYNKIYVCLDDDDPGRATAKKLAGWLSGFIPDVRVPVLPRKDASQCLKDGLIDDVIKAILNTKQYTPEGIVHGSSITIADLVKAMPIGFDTPFPEFNKKYRGVRKGEILTVCAGSGIGKSTFVRELAYDLVVRHNASVCHIALEDLVETTAASYVAMDNNVPSAVFRTDPTCIPVSNVEASMDRTVRKMYFFNHFGSIDSTTFREKLAYYARSGVDFIILDHLSMIISGSDISNERKEIDKIMTDLAEMVVATGVGLINVVHLKRRESRSEGASLNEGGSVSLTDLRGSAALEQLSWGVVAIERNQQAEDGSEDFSAIRILKNRTWGLTGKAGKVQYVHSTGRMIPVKEEEPPDPFPIDTPEEEVEKQEAAQEESDSEDFLETLSKL